MSEKGIESNVNKSTYIIANDDILRIKAIDLNGTKLNMTASDHLVYQKLHHMYQQLGKVGKHCLPSKRWLSYQLCITERSVAKSLDKLRDVGLVNWRKIKRYGHLRNVYTVSSELAHKIYVADLREPVSLANAEDAIQKRLNELCGENDESQSSLEGVILRAQQEIMDDDF